MQVLQCPSPTCGRPFQLNQFNAHPSRPLVRGRIVCPHCNHAFAGDADSVYLTHALTEHQESCIPRPAPADRGMSESGQVRSE